MLLSCLFVRQCAVGNGWPPLGQSINCCAFSGAFPLFLTACGLCCALCDDCFHAASVDVIPISMSVIDGKAYVAFGRQAIAGDACIASLKVGCVA